MKTRITLRTVSNPVALLIGRFQTWFTDHIVQNVPDEVSVCEYECPETSCHVAKWALCEKRLPQVSNGLLHID